MTSYFNKLIIATPRIYSIGVGTNDVKSLLKKKLNKYYLQFLSTLAEMGGRRGGGGTPGVPQQPPTSAGFPHPTGIIDFPPFFKLQSKPGSYLSKPVQMSWMLGMTPAMLLSGRLFHLRN